MNGVHPRNSDKFTWKGGLGPYLGEGLTGLAGLLSRTESLRFCFRITRVGGKWRQREMV